jgi:hypothetical protein
LHPIRVSCRGQTSSSMSGLDEHDVHVIGCCKLSSFQFEGCHKSKMSRRLVLSAEILYCTLVTNNFWRGLGATRALAQKTKNCRDLFSKVRKLLANRGRLLFCKIMNSVQSLQLCAFCAALCRTTYRSRHVLGAQKWTESQLRVCQLCL